jgi:intein/homing endonuclease
LENALTLSGKDEEIIREVSKLIGAKEYSKSCDKNYSWNFYFTEKSNIKGVKSRILTRNLFQDFTQELCTDSINKRIPKIYKLGSIEQRFNLLQGLMDTDGSIDNEDKGRTRFTSINLPLI